MALQKTQADLLDHAVRAVTGFHSWTDMEASMSRGYTPTLRMPPELLTLGHPGRIPYEAALESVKDAVVEAGYRYFPDCPID